MGLNVLDMVWPRKVVLKAANRLSDGVVGIIPRIASARMCSYHGCTHPIV